MVLYDVKMGHKLDQDIINSDVSSCTIPIKFWIATASSKYIYEFFNTVVTVS